MQDLLTYLGNITRPRLLVRAARIGAREYCRDRHLARLLGFSNLPRSAEAAIQLSEIESDLDFRRQQGDAGYSLVRHLDVLIALIGEAELLRRPDAG